MNSWINLDALWKIVVIGLLAGAGLPALFAVGLRALAPRERTAIATDAGTGTGAEAVPQRAADPRGKLFAGLCFALVLAAMAWGIYSIIQNR